jgi:hypothetical protein
MVKFNGRNRTLILASSAQFRRPPLRLFSLNLFFEIKPHPSTVNMSAHVTSIIDGFALNFPTKATIDYKIEAVFFPYSLFQPVT